jgi:NAD(P)H-nitrite reductase large subunit
MPRYLIVGNSAAGVGALEAIRKIDRQSPVTVVSDESYPLYSRCLLSYYLAGKIGDERLHFRPADFHQKMAAELVAGVKAVSVDAAKNEVTLADGRRLGYDRLLIATGGSARIPRGIPADVPGVFVLRTIGDALAILKRIESSTHAVVLGGGLVGMKAAFALAQRGLKVTVVVRSRHVLSQMIDLDAAAIVEARLRESGVEALTGADVTAVEAKDGRLAAARVEVESQAPRTIPCEILIAAKGVEPNAGMIAGTPIEKKTGIVTDAHMQTSAENIYAAGDVAETFDIATGDRSVNALWTCAAQQGRIAGLNMAGQPREYDGSIGMNSINFPGVDLISFGVVRPAAGAGCQVLTDSRPAVGIYRKLVLKDNRVRGLILVNKIDNAGVLLSLLSRKIDVGGYKDDLLTDRFSYAEVLGHGGAEEWHRYRNAAQIART